MQTISRENLLTILQNLKTIMNENKDFLIELDSMMGDGDLGLTMSKAFSAAWEEIGETEETDLGKLLSKTGMVMAKAAPSTMGTLMGTGFIRGGKAVAGKSELTTKDVADFFQAFVQGIMDRGKAKPGEKTIIDSLKPAAEALAASDQSDPRDALSEALKAAEEGLEATKDMVAQHGRIAYYKDKAKGEQDPGATVAVLVIKGFITY